MKKILERVDHLLKLTKSSSEEEARTAAVQACRLILKHSLVITQPVAPVTEAAADLKKGINDVGGFVVDTITTSFSNAASKVTIGDLYTVFAKGRGRR